MKLRFLVIGDAIAKELRKLCFGEHPSPSVETVKPRFRMLHQGVWECEGGGDWHIATNPYDAYANWRQLHDFRQLCRREGIVV